VPDGRSPCVRPSRRTGIKLTKDETRRIAVNFAKLDELLISGFLARISGLTERLAAGVGVLDVGCGSAHAVNVKTATVDISGSASSNATVPASIGGCLRET